MEKSNKINVGAAVALGVGAAVAYYYYSDGVKKHKIEVHIEDLDCKDLNPELHVNKPLIAVTEEAKRMLKQSMKKTKDEYQIVPVYPIATDMLFRNMFEQSIKLFLIAHGIEIKDRCPLVKLREEMKTFTAQNNDYESLGKMLVNIGTKMEDLNASVHNPTKGKSVVQDMELGHPDFSIIVFVKKVVECVSNLQRTSNPC